MNNLKGSAYLTESNLLRKKACEKISTKTIRKNWNNLQINNNLKEIFKREPTTSFKQNKNIQKFIGARWIKNKRVKKDLKTLKKVNAYHAGQKLKIYVANKWKLQQHSRANKQTKLGRYFTTQTVRQDMPFAYGVRNMQPTVCR